MQAIVQSAGAYSDEEARNRAVVLDYYERLIGKWDYEAASIHLGPRFVQHNPTILDGREGLKAFADNVPPEIAATLKHEIVRVLADGDMVMLHVLVTVPQLGQQVIVDLFRLEHGKVVEHWDVIQPVPAEAVHGNGMI